MMKKTILFPLWLALLTPLAVTAQGIEFFKGTWQEAMQEAREQGKLLFVDAYAKWCGPCKRMAATTFRDAGVGDYFNEYFINMKIDMEEGEGLSFRKKYPVSAFPTLFFMDEQGEVLLKVVGAQDVSRLMKLAQEASGKVDYSKEYAAAYEAGNREPDLVYDYVKALRKSGKSSLSVANEYLRTQKDLSTEFNLRFIYEAAETADSRIFELLVRYQREVAVLVGWQEVRDRIESACDATARKAAQYQSKELLDEAKEKMSAHYPERSEAFAAGADLLFHKVMQDAKGFGKACADYEKAVAHGDPKLLDRLANELLTFFDTDAACMKLAEKYARESAQNGKQTSYFVTYAEILHRNGKKKQALEAARKALELSKSGGSPTEQEVMQLISRLES